MGILSNIFGKKETTSVPDSATAVGKPIYEGGKSTITQSDIDKSSTSARATGTPIYSSSGGTSGSGGSSRGGGGVSGTTQVAQDIPETTSPRVVGRSITGEGEKVSKPRFSLLSREGRAEVEFGVPIIKEEERERGIVGYVPQATGLMGTLEEVKMTPFIQTSPSTFVSRVAGRTKEDIIFTQTNIFEAESRARKYGKIQEEFSISPEAFIGREGVETKETGIGTEITLTPKYFEKEIGISRRESIVQAREFFGGLPRGRKAESIASSILTGTVGFGVGVVEFGGTLLSSFGVKEIEKPEEFKPFSFGKGIKIGGEIGKFTEQPSMPTTTTFLESPKTYVYERFLTSPQFLTKAGITATMIGIGGAGAIKNIRAYGIKEGLGETISYFSPIRPASGVYMTKITPESEVRVLSFKGQKGDYISRTIIGVGKDEPFTIISRQLSKQVGGKMIEVGGIQTNIIIPTTYIRGGSVKIGQTITGFEGFVSGKGGGTASLVKSFGGISGKVSLEEFQSGIGTSLLRQKYSVFVYGEPTGLKGIGTIFPKTSVFSVSKTGGIAKEGTKGITEIVAGKRTSIGEVVEGVYQPSGRYKIKPTITGYEIDINAVYGKEGGITSFVGGGKKTPFSSTFSNQQLQKQISSISSSISQVKPVSFSIPKTRTIVSTGLIESSYPTYVGGTQISSLTLQRAFVFPKTSDLLRYNERESTALFPVLRGQFGYAPRQISPQISGLVSGQAERQISRQMQAQVSRQIIPTTPIMQFGFGAGFGFAPMFPAFFPPLGFTTSKGKQVGGKRTFAYQPSLAAIGLGIKTPKIPKGVFTGLILRPIISKSKKKKKKGGKK